MKILRNALLILPALLFVTSALNAQDKAARVSPQDTVTATIDGNELKVVYSRPFTKDPKTGEPRKIWGGLVPFGQVWRTGANEATVLTTAKPITIGGTAIPAGTYSLFTIPTEDGGKLIVNKQTGQPGTKYDEAQDLTRVDMKKEPLAQPLDQFKIAIDDNKEGGVLRLMWENAQYSVPFTVAK
jgi:frataxin-like iron-binding protein CyaY